MVKQIKKNKGFLKKEKFCNFCPTTKRQFCVRDPKRRLIQETQEKEYQDTLKTCET